MKLSICTFFIFVSFIALILPGPADGRSSGGRNHRDSEESVEKIKYRPRGRSFGPPDEQQGRQAGGNDLPIEEKPDGVKQQGRGLLAELADTVTGIVSGILGTNRGWPYHGGLGAAPGGAAPNPYGGTPHIAPLIAPMPPGYGR